MKRLGCLIFLVLLAAVFVQSETRIEVDENGDEYEVKRFTIEGRQLNGGRRQCIETRRKRATNSNADSKQEESDEQQQGGLAAIYTLSASQESNGMSEEGNAQNAAVQEEEDEDEEHEEIANGNKMEAHAEQNTQQQTVQEVFVANDVPVALAPASVAKPNGGIVVVQADEPPRVNPNTHAVFELVPVPPTTNVIVPDYADPEDIEIDEDYDADHVGIDELYNYEEDISPVTTTAIWSTGDDGGDGQSVAPQKPTAVKTQKKKTRKSNKKKKNKRKSHKPGNKLKRKPSRRIKKKNKGHGIRRRPTRRPGSKGSVVKAKRKRRPYLKRRPRPGHAINRVVTRRRRRRPNRKTMRRGNKKRNGLRKQGNRQGALNDESHALTRTVTLTPGDSDRINCIIINKTTPPPTTTTTPRPFWNILGRDANGRPVASGHYGKRKRVNVRME